LLGESKKYQSEKGLKLVNFVHTAGSELKQTQAIFTTVSHSFSGM